MRWVLSRWDDQDMPLACTDINQWQMRFPLSLPLVLFQLEMMLSDYECTTTLGAYPPRAKPQTTLGPRCTLLMELSWLQTYLFSQTTTQTNRETWKEGAHRFSLFKIWKVVIDWLIERESTCCSPEYVCTFSIQQKILPSDKVEAHEGRLRALRPWDLCFFS